MQTNARQVADWNGRSGDRWLAHQARLDEMLAPFGEAALAAAKPSLGERVLDIGCGAGATAFALASQVGPTGHVLGVDISEPLVGRARARTPVQAPVTFQLADASRAPLERGGFDLLFSRFGVMFFDDPQAGFDHLRQGLRPGGRLTFACWRGARDNDWVRLPTEAIAGIAPASAPLDPEAPGPFSFGDRQRVARILASAGFEDVALTAFDHPFLFGRGATRDAAIDDALSMAFELGPLTRALADQPDDVWDKASAAVRAAFAQRATPEGVLIDGAAWIVTARNPG